MSILHICNTHFEWELDGALPPTLEAAFAQNPIFLQLQFLPLVYGSIGDGLVVTAFPEKFPESELTLYPLISKPPFQKISSWGHSKLIQDWAVSRGIHYEMPPWDLIKMVNSKAYSFAKSPLPNSRLIFDDEEFSPGFVLKSCFGTAGTGHMFSENPKAKEFCQMQWRKNLPVIAEPWVFRIVDFSTQWFISTDGQITYLGVSFCKSSKTGVHQSNTVGDYEREKKYAYFISEQKEIASAVLQEMSDLGYFGNVGFDAMIYLEGSEEKLQPIVEINARKTMGFVALMLYKKYKKPLELAYINSTAPGLLPNSVIDAQGNKKPFSKQLISAIQ